MPDHSAALALQGASAGRYQLPRHDLAPHGHSSIGRGEIGAVQSSAVANATDDSLPIHSATTSS